MGGQMYQQQVHQAMQQGGPSHLTYQGQQQQHFSENPAYTDSGGGGSGSNAGSMPCHYQNYQVGQ